MISIKECTIKYDRILIDRVDIEIYDQEITLIRGDNGTGKTSLLYIIGLLSKNNCKYLFDDVDIRQCSKQQLSQLKKKEIGYVFQDNNLLYHFTVFENFEYYAKLLGKTITREEVVNCLNQFNLKISLDKYPDKISGGQRQRLSIALATIKNPRLIILDEPTSALDDNNTALVIEMLNKIKQENKCMIVVVSHDKMLRQCADRIYYIKDKQISLEKENGLSVKSSDFLNLKKTSFSCFWYLSKYMRYYKKFYAYISLLLIVAISVTALGNNYFNNYSKRFVEAVERATVNEIAISNIQDMSQTRKKVISMANIEATENVKQYVTTEFKVNGHEFLEEMNLQTYTAYQPMEKNSSIKEKGTEDIYINFYFANQYGIKENDEIEIKVGDEYVRLVVSGMLNEGVSFEYLGLNEPDIYLPDRYDWLLESDVLLAYCTDLTEMNNTVNDLGFTLETEQISYDYKQVSAYIDIIKTTNTATQWFSMILILITIIVVTLIFFRNTKLRKYEFALLRANGLTKKDIMILSCETTLILLFSLLVGALLLSYMVSGISIMLHSSYFTITKQTFVLITQLSLVSLVIPTIISTMMSVTYEPSKVLRS